MDLQTKDAVDFQAIYYVEITADIVSAYLSHSRVPAAELPSLLAGVHAALAGLDQSAEAPEPAITKLTPAQVRRSITPDTLISFIDGKPYKTLKCHLTKHGLTMDEYRERFGLPRDYPSTAASYSAARSDLARQSDLGRKQRLDEPEAADNA